MKIQSKIENLNEDGEIEALDLLSSKWSSEYTYVGRDVMSRVDAFLTRNNELKGIVEVKCRMQVLSWFREYDSCMVSFNKIQIASDLSRLLQKMFFFVIQTGDKHLLVFQITDNMGRIVCPMNIRVSKAQVNKNFEKKETINAYLSIDSNIYCKIIKNEL
jgi:hypothetical protein